MTTFFTVIHVLICFVLILVVLLQTGKGSEVGAVFGGSSQTVFGSTGAAPFLSRLTTAVAVLFMLTSLGLAMFSAQTGTSLMDDEVAVPTAPIAPPLPEPIAIPESEAPKAETPQALPAEQAAPVEKTQSGSPLPETAAEPAEELPIATH